MSKYLLYVGFLKSVLTGHSFFILPHLHFFVFIDNEPKWRATYQRETPVTCYTRKSEVCARTDRTSMVNAVQTDRRIP